MSTFVGKAAVEALLKGTRHIYSDGLTNIFTKKGGYIQALEDFESVNPIKVKNARRKGGIVST